MNSYVVRRSKSRFCMCDVLNLQVCEKCKTRTHLSRDLWWSELSLELPLYASHFSTGRLTLRCVAQVDDLYQQDVEVRLDKFKDPVPERGTYLKNTKNSFSYSVFCFYFLNKNVFDIFSYCFSSHLQ